VERETMKSISSYQQRVLAMPPRPAPKHARVGGVHALSAHPGHLTAGVASIIKCYVTRGVPRYVHHRDCDVITRRSHLR
jgi:hypothetical protein